MNKYTVRLNDGAPRLAKKSRTVNILHTFESPYPQEPMSRNTKLDRSIFERSYINDDSITEMNTT